MNLIEYIKKLFNSKNRYEQTYGKIITQEGSAFSGNDYFKITIRWKGKVNKKILQKNRSECEKINLVELTPKSKNAKISIRHYEATGKIFNEFFLSG